MDYSNTHSHVDGSTRLTEYEDRYGTVVLLEDPTRAGAWLLSTYSVPVER
ncbi:hypothetical protein SAMN04487948_102479 [Halogranum amylolyticum]|uniref:Uncharacterized protein n=1 Tax=Halogranum amylolyticum TaxID=660520 RepID=A0A1H8PTU1_9EURY|nr:hypothetical protein [Halogranum amylolyticum]SEO45117.1 hypothetical protein SAMN04487948_102479 [Halogranum amylolyticum]